MNTPEQVGVNGFEFTIIPYESIAHVEVDGPRANNVFRVPIPGGLTGKKIEYLDAQGGIWVGRLTDDWDVTLWTLVLEKEPETEGSSVNRNYTVLRLRRGMELSPPAPDDFWFDTVTTRPLGTLTEQQKESWLTVAGRLLRGMQES